MAIDMLAKEAVTGKNCLFDLVLQGIIAEVVADSVVKEDNDVVGVGAIAVASAIEAMGKVAPKVATNHTTIVD